MGWNDQQGMKIKRICLWLQFRSPEKAWLQETTAIKYTNISNLIHFFVWESSKKENCEANETIVKYFWLLCVNELRWWMMKWWYLQIAVSYPGVNWLNFIFESVCWSIFLFPPRSTNFHVWQGTTWNAQDKACFNYCWSRSRCCIDCSWYLGCTEILSVSLSHSSKLHL